jgi:hypothetical protein
VRERNHAGCIGPRERELYRADAHFRFRIWEGLLRLDQCRSGQQFPPRLAEQPIFYPVLPHGERVR